MAAPLGEPSTRANPCCIIPYLQEPIMTQSPGAQFERLLEIMRRLREPGGCPWDREETRASLKPFLVEETYEVLEAIESGEAEALREELGDLLLQVVFHAQIAAERGEFDMAALLARLVDKMISRHPHVFGETTLGTPGEALAQWEAIKQREAHAAVHRHGGRSEREGQERGERVAGRARALVGSGEGAGARAMKAKVGSASISVERGDITDREVDALVNPANTALTMTTGVAAAIKRKGGVIIEEEAMRQGPVEVGEALLTPGGNLQATHVIHAVVMGADLKTDAEVVARATRAALAVADKHRLTSIALPALGTGLGHVAPGAAADAMMEAVAAHLKGGKTALKRGVFVLYLDDAYRAFTDTLKRVGGIQ